MAGPNDEWPILADPNPDDEEWPLEPNIDPAPPPNRANVSPVLVRARAFTALEGAVLHYLSTRVRTTAITKTLCTECTMIPIQALWKRRDG